MVGQITYQLFLQLLAPTKRFLLVQSVVFGANLILQIQFHSDLVFLMYQRCY